MRPISILSLKFLLYFKSISFLFSLIKEKIIPTINFDLAFSNIYKNKNLQIYLNGTTEPDENVNFMKTQRNKFSNISNKPNYHSNVNTTKNRGGLNRYNSYKRIATTNINNNALFNLPKNNKIIKNKKTNGGSKNKLISHNNSKGHNNTHIHNNQKMPFSNNKKSIIPLGNNKYKTIGDNRYKHK